MIEVHQLSKRYGSTTAVEEISFTVQKGEVVGFLGPNGAGKSTTMRMLAAYLPPTSGTARVAGYDVFTQSLQAREHIGYMPENVPLYPEMRVREYLKYRAALKGVKSRRIRERLMDVLDLCSLTDVAHKLIGNLSKGYRQRVGLADAMIHDPELLILDEPTIGLDPNQIRQVRELIRNLARHHTILLSTHILSEVEMTCGRVLIINGGKVAAVDTPQNLRNLLHQSGTLVLEIRPPDDRAAADTLRELPGILAVQAEALGEGWQRYQLDLAEETSDPRQALADLCRQRDWPLRELSRRAISLEDVFAQITSDSAHEAHGTNDTKEETA
jgi:ABC-2 type transport system ATP-binding protein